MQKRSPTSPGTKKLSEVAKKIVVPDGIVSTAYPSVREQCRKMGIRFDRWQAGLARLILSKRAGGLYAAGIGGVFISICRQVGKTYLIAAIIFALCIIFPGFKVLWTAHRSRTSDETFKWMASFTKRRKIAPHIDTVRLGSGQQEVIFRNGSRILFGARENGFGRGFDDVDAVIFDEAQILTEKALDDMVPSANAAKNPLIIYLGTPPKPTDPSAVWLQRREEAWKGTLKNAVFVEVGADPDADPEDREQWGKANPSYPHRTREDAILRLKQQLGLASFLREGLGIYDSDRGTDSEISEKEWTALAVGMAPVSPLRCIGVAFSADGMRMSIGGAIRKGQRVHGELLDAATGPVDGGLAAVADWLCELDDEQVPRWKRTAGIIIAGDAGAKTLERYLLERKVPRRYIQLLSTGQVLAACAFTRDLVTAKNFTHLDDGQEQLDASVLSSVKNFRGKSGAWAWHSPDGDETPIESVSFAAWGTHHSPLARRRRSSDGRRKAVSL